MSNTILLKRSAVANSVPTTGNLALGELAINTYDGKLYTKIDNGTPSIFELTQNQTITLTGNITGSGTSTINATLSTTGVSANTYGGTGVIPSIVVDQYGRITSASNVAISTSSISNGTSNVSIATSGGNVTTSVGGSANILIVTSTGANVTGYITATGNVTAPYFIGDLVGNITGNIDAAGSNTEVQFNDGDLLGASANFTFNKSTNVLNVNGNVSGGNLVTAAGGNVVLGNAVSVFKQTGSNSTISLAGSIVLNPDTAASATNGVQIGGSGYLLSPSGARNAQLDYGASSGTMGIYAVNVYGNTATAITNGGANGVGNIGANSTNRFNTFFGVAVDATGNVTGGNLVTSGLLSVTGNANVGNIGGTNAVFTNLTGTLTTAAQPNITSVGTLTSLSVTGNVAAGNVSGTNIDGTTVTASGNLVGGNANITSAVNAATVTATGNITAGNVITSGSSGNITGANVVSANTFNASANVLAGNLNSNAAVTGVTGVFSGNVSTGNVSGTNGTFTNVTGTLTTAAQPNITSVGTLSSLTVTGNVSTGNVSGTNGTFTNVAGTLTTAAQPNITSVGTLGNLTVTGNVATGNVSGTLGSFTTVTATGNVNGGNVVTNKIDGTGVTIASTGNLNLEPTGNIVLGNRFVNGVAYPAQDQDAASKIYVDNMVSTALTYHAAVVVATTDTLANITGGTVTYAQPNGAGNGIGATLTTTGSFNLIDTANVQTVGTRILVKDQANGVQNGVYVWSNATVITRSTDADEYGPSSVEQLSINDYFFVQSGNVNKGSAFVVDAPAGTITFGTSNIQFAQFSSSQTYTANTSAGIVINGTVISAKVDNNTTAFDGLGNISVKAGANLTTPNIGDATGNSLTLSGNGLVSATTVTATGNVTGGNLVTGGLLSVTGNANVGNVGATNAVFTNVAGTLTTAAQPNITSVGTLTSLDVTGNVSTGNVSGTTGTFTNVAGTLTTAAQPNVTSVGTLTSLTVTGNVAAGNVSGTLLTGTLTTAAQPNVTSVGTLTSLTVTGNANVGNVGATNAVLTGSLTGATSISASGNITGGNLVSNALVSGTTGTFTGNVTAGNANITSATISTSTTTGALIVAGGAGIAGNVYAGDIYKNGVIVLNANDNIDGGTY